MKTIYHWDSEKGQAYCYIKYKNKIFQGYASCHPDDVDFCSECTGLTIAEDRAQIEYLQYLRDTEIKPAMNILTHLKGNIEKSKNHNPKSYEFKMLCKQLHHQREELKAINYEIAELKQNLKTYIDEKDKFYKKLRERRKKENKNV